MCPSSSPTIPLICCAIWRIKAKRGRICVSRSGLIGISQKCASSDRSARSAQARALKRRAPSALFFWRRDQIDFPESRNRRSLLFLGFHAPHNTHRRNRPPVQARRSAGLSKSGLKISLGAPSGGLPVLDARLRQIEHESDPAWFATIAHAPHLKPRMGRSALYSGLPEADGAQYPACPSDL